MEGVRKSYSEFHKVLTFLASQVVPKFGKGTPEKLKNITYLPLLFTPEDEEFRSNNPDRLIEKIISMLDGTLFLYLPLKLCVIGSELGWLKGQFELLALFATITFYRLFDLRLSEPAKIEAVVAGIGSFNAGTFSNSVNNEAVQKIDEMLTRKLDQIPWTKQGIDSLM